ncbi:MAG: hypothetical protein HHAS10_06300 [Candidatus Altimarinota bacterium]
MATPKNYRYKIKIVFNNTDNNGLLLDRNDIPYYGSNKGMDTFKIYGDHIIINAERSKKIDLSSIFTNYVSSLYFQILKSIIYYYGKTGKFNPIEEISIETLNIKNSKQIDSLLLSSDHFNQVLDKSFNIPYSIQDSSLEAIFQEDEKGKNLLIIISNLLAGSCNNLGKNETFDILWKSFNGLYKLITSKTKDHEALKELKRLVNNNTLNLNHSLQIANTLTSGSIRNNPIRFREMILNNFSKENDTLALSDMIQRYSDKRLMEIFQDTKFCYREEFLRKKGLLSDVSTHISNNISGNTNKDSDIVLFLTGIYMYFARNKNFHGETINHKFRITSNKLDKEYIFLNKLLQAYIIDLINNQ